MPVTILDAYIEHFKQLIIVISGMSGSNKSDIAKELAGQLNCKHISQNNYLDSNFQQTTEINGKKIKIWDSDDAIDWIKFNTAVGEALIEHKILVVSGTTFNKDKISFKVDYHIHLKLSKQVLLEKRHAFIEEHADDPKYADNLNLDEQTERLLMNTATYPYYLKMIESNVINKFLNINELQQDEISRKVFQLVIQFIEHKLYKSRTDLKWNENTRAFENI